MSDNKLHSSHTIEQLQRRVTRSLAVEQELINSRYKLDAEIHRFTAIYECGQALLATTDKASFANRLAEAVIDIFETECALVWLTEAGQVPIEPTSNADSHFLEQDWEKLSLWLNDIYTQEGVARGVVTITGSEFTVLPIIDRLIACPMLNTSGELMGVVFGAVSVSRSGFYDFQPQDTLGSFGVFCQLASTLFQNHLDTAKIKRHNQDLKIEVAEHAHKLVHAEKMASLGTLAAGVAHEINNPIGFVKSNLLTLSDYAQTFLPALQNTLQQNRSHSRESKELTFIVEDLSSLLQATIQGVDRVSNIVASLKRFSHPSHHVKQRIDVNRSIENALSLTHNQTKHEAIMHIDLQPLPEVVGNESELSQVFVNLIVNAVAARDVRGDIFVRSSVAEDHIRVDVSDNGRGISPDHLAHIFDPFFTTKAIGEGTGLGLSISHGIVEDHGGTMTVESELGKGTRFSVFLPVRSE
jgi:signal transduction histidine kinase